MTNLILYNGSKAMTELNNCNGHVRNQLLAIRFAVKVDLRNIDTCICHYYHASYRMYIAPRYQVVHT